MFQFPGLPSHRLCIYLWILKHYLKCVPAFGNLRIIGYLLLPAAYRSLSRPSSAPGAKASALCSLLLDLLLVFSLQPSLSHSFQDKLFSNTHTSVMCGIFYYCFTRSENFLVFSVNQWNCILRSLSEPTKFWKNTLVIYLDFVFVVNLLIHNLILYSVFKVHSVWILSIQWWAWEDSNLRPHAYQACALTTWATSPYKLIVQKLKSP